MQTKVQIKKNDTVLVTSGREKGKRGRVIAVYPAEKRLLVEKLNMIKRHTRPNQQLKQGGIVEKEMPIQISNVALFNPATQKADRVGFKTLDDGRKVRVFKSNSEVVDA